MSVAKACHASNPEVKELKDPFLHSTRERRALSSRNRVTSASCPAAANFWTVFLGPEPKTSPQIWWISIDHFSWAWATMSCDIWPATAIADLCLASTVLLQALELNWALARPRYWCIGLSPRPHRVAWAVARRSSAACVGCGTCRDSGSMESRCFQWRTLCCTRVAASFFLHTGQLGPRQPSSASPRSR